MNNPSRRLSRVIVVGPGVVVIILLCLYFSFGRHAESDVFRPQDALAKVQLAVQSLRRGNVNTTAVPGALKRLTEGDDENEKLLLAAVSELDQNLAKLYQSGTLHDRYTLDLERFQEKIAKGNSISGTPFSIAYPAIRRLREERTLRSLKWSELTDDGEGGGKETIVAEVPRSLFDQRNPWGGVRGRIVLEERSKDGNEVNYLMLSGQLPTREADKIAVTPLQERYPSLVIPGTAVVRRALAQYLVYDSTFGASKSLEGVGSVGSGTAFAKSLVEKGNIILVRGKEVPAGYDVIITIDPHLQQVAQTQVHHTLNRSFIEDVRFMAMDIDTGEILAVAEGANTAPKQDALPLIFQVIPPASTTKIIFASALLEMGAEVTKISPAAVHMLEQLPLKVKTSETKYFQKMALEFDAAPLYLKQAERFGWNGDCSSEGNCTGGVIDYLFGTRIYQSTAAPYEFPITGRILIEPVGAGRFHPLASRKLTALPSLNSLQNSKPLPGMARERFDTGKLVKTQVAGQGDCRSSLWGELLLISHVVHAAGGKTEVPLPHLVREVRNAKGSKVSIAPTAKSVPVALSQENGRRLARYLAEVNCQGGTAYSTFFSVFGRGPGIADKIIAKTGTTDFESLATPFRLYVAAYARKPGGTLDTAIISVIKMRIGEVRKANIKLNEAAELALRVVKDTQHGM